MESATHAKCRPGTSVKHFRKVRIIIPEMAQNTLNTNEKYFVRTDTPELSSNKRQ